ncbi:12558_t:CDS:2 [Entrophospora sp. SA101]|nr:12558_t:CDS:2 [Entrophospora sp. SA101]
MTLNQDDILIFEALLKYFKGIINTRQLNASSISSIVIAAINLTSKALIYDYKKYLLNFLKEHRIQEEKTALKSIRRARELQMGLKILGVIFEYLDLLEIVKTVMATCQQWREIGINIISRRLRCEIERISESLVYFSGTNRKNNDDDDNVEGIVETQQDGERSPRNN